MPDNYPPGCDKLPWDDEPEDGDEEAAEAHESYLEDEAVARWKEQPYNPPKED